LQKKLWPEDTFVDFDHSLNTAINKLREVLGDSAENPKYVETLPRRGYRFIYPVAAASSPPLQDGVAIHELPPATTDGRAIRGSPLRRHWRLAATGGVLVGALLALNIGAPLPFAEPFDKFCRMM